MAGPTILTKLKNLKPYKTIIAAKIFHLYQEMNASIINLNPKLALISFQTAVLRAQTFFVQPTKCNFKHVTIIQMILHQLLFLEPDPYFCTLHQSSSCHYKVINNDHVMSSWITWKIEIEGRIMTVLKLWILNTLSSVFISLKFSTFFSLCATNSSRAT